MLLLNYFHLVQPFVCIWISFRSLRYAYMHDLSEYELLLKKNLGPISTDNGDKQSYNWNKSSNNQIYNLQMFYLQSCRNAGTYALRPFYCTGRYSNCRRKHENWQPVDLVSSFGCQLCSSFFPKKADHNSYGPGLLIRHVVTSGKK